MWGSTINRLLIALTLIVLITGALWRLSNSKPHESAIPHSSASVPKAERVIYNQRVRHSADVEQSTDAATVELPKILPRQIEEWLTTRNRNAASLLAAFRLSGDTNYLNEAAANFPKDPAVQMAVLARNAFPEERRKWLDLLKASSPDNSLANYLSAQDYVKQGQTDQAIQDLLTASGKSAFETHVMDAQLNSEDLSRFSGKSPVETAELGLEVGATDSLYIDATLKKLANSIGDLQAEKSRLGDATSVENLASMGLLLADQLRNGDSCKLVINDLVGKATEAIVISHLDQNAPYDFLGGQTPAQALQTIQKQKAELNEMRKAFSLIQAGLSDAEKVGYFERMKIYGEEKAVRWVIQQHQTQ